MIVVNSKLFKTANRYYLQEQISLLDGFLMLWVLQDSICRQGKIRDIDKLKRIRSMVFLRNNSIFAHGLGPIDRSKYLEFKEFVEMIFIEFCGLEEISFKENRENVQWLNPVNSANYSGLEG